MPRNIKLLLQVTLCPTDGLYFIMKKKTAAVLCTKLHLPIVTKPVLKWQQILSCLP
jgi:hypothetical protein